MGGFGVTWAFVGLFTGLGKLALVAALALLLFGGTDALRRFAPRSVRPFLPRARGGSSRDPWPGRREGRIVLALVVAAVAAWVATRLTRIAPARSNR